MDVVKILNEAITQIEKKNHGRSYDNPALLAIVIDDKQRLITAWGSLEIKSNK
jgi:hypothetical protein